MLERKALFRGGEEELMSPFSPRKTVGRQESGLRQGVRSSGIDFWKRLSVRIKLDQLSKSDRYAWSAFKVEEY